MNVCYSITVNVLLILKVREIIFFAGKTCTVMGHFEGFFNGADLFDPYVVLSIAKGNFCHLYRAVSCKLTS